MAGVVNRARKAGDGMVMRVVNLDATEYRRKRERVHVKSLTGEVSQLCFIKLEHGEATDHAHENEQIGYIVRGEVEITVDGRRTVLRPGDGYVIPANMRHGFRVVSVEPVEYLEVFSPPKEGNR
jgi:mannose-6-phosphate isomerase-like protein (cupin superfamily)